MIFGIMICVWAFEGAGESGVHEMKVVWRVIDSGSLVLEDVRQLLIA
jgi:hypothetical protein